MSLEGWQELNCSKCNSKKVVQVHQLMWRDQHGTTAKPDGYQCATCGSVVDVASAIAAARQQALNRKIRELQDEAL